MKIAEPR